ncbi:hypothetical protein BVC80_8185g2 [Macleaya cordata]|uniref:Transmembrane protein n=1 Tax=Macleaya cordata TaxID=56857 RepID=A0A200QGA3_MACCD|nr:hypothetical protein BVC80_8185g2 [Macleaya cordata]
MARRVSPWIEVAPALLISPQKPSTSSKLETIFEEVTDGHEDVTRRRKLFVLLFFSSFLLFIEMWFCGMISMMKNRQILSWVRRMEIEPKRSKVDKSGKNFKTMISVHEGIKLM